jgi:hypothetical protein
MRRLPPGTGFGRIGPIDKSVLSIARTRANEVFPCST